MAVNFPTSFDSTASLFGDLKDFIIVTLSSGVNSSVTSLTFAPTGDIDAIAIDTSLVFNEKGSSPVTFTGAGLNDMTLGGAYTGNAKKTSYVVEVDGVGTPNTFKWSRDGGSTWVATGVSCSTGAVSLEAGLTVSFGATTGHTVGNKWSWSSGFEIVRVTAKGGAGSGTVTVTRGFDNSTAMAHSTGAGATQDPTAYDIGKLREALLAAQKYAGLVGLDASKPASCSPGNVYIATNTGKVYVCFTTNTWTWVNRGDHGDFANLGADDHTQYHNDSRKATWHTALAGDHITTLAHNHDGTGTQGNPVRKFKAGLDANKGTPTAVGQVYYATDTNSLFFSANGSSWEIYTTVPTGSIMFFESSCPAGWQAFTGLNQKFPKGRVAATWTGATTGGASTHTHTMPDVINHTHTIAQSQATSDYQGSHDHSFNVRSGTGTNDEFYYNVATGAGSLPTSGSGDHSHTATVSAHNTNSSGLASPSTASASSLPVYYSLIACEKL